MGDRSACWGSTGERPRAPEMPTRLTIGSVACFAGWLLAAVVGCGQPATEPAAAPRVTATPDELVVEFDRPRPLDRVAVETADGQPVVQLRALGTQPRFAWTLAWPGPGRYRARLYTAAGDRNQSAEIGFQLEAETSPVRASLELPAGQDSWTLGDGQTRRVAVPADGRFALSLIVQQRQQVATRWQWQIDWPAEWKIDHDRAENARPTGEPLAGSWSDETSLAADYRQRQWTLPAPRRPVVLPLRFAWWPAELGSQRPATARSVAARLEVVPASAEQLEQALVVRGVTLPVDSTGQRDWTQPSGTLMQPSAGFSWMRKWWPGAWQLANPHEPRAWQAVELENRGAAALNLLVEADVTLPERDEALSKFGPPAWLAPRGGAAVQQWLQIGGGQTASVRLPVYLDADTPPGHYRRRIRVFALGALRPVREIDQPLRVIRLGSWAAALGGGTLLAAPLAWAAGALWLAWLSRRLASDALATIGLMAGLQFVISLASRLAGDLLAGFLGPFSHLVTGLVSEGVLTGLMAATVVLLPRPGTWTVLSLAVFTLNAVFSGQLGLVDLLFVTVGVAWGESCLLLAGVTWPARRARAPLPSGWGAAWRLAAALGMANALTLLTQYALQQVLYRLYFAAWYLALMTLVTGLLYGAVGAAWGARLGQRLQRSVA